MRQSRSLYLILSGAVLILVLTLATLPGTAEVFAQAEPNEPAAESPTPPPTEPPTPTATAVSTETAVPTATAEPTATATPPAVSSPTAVDPTATPAPPAPVSIPEPITVVLFGTGLAALSAAAASRRKNEGKGDGE